MQELPISGESNRLDERPKDVACADQVANLSRRGLPVLAGDARESRRGNAAWGKWLARFGRPAGTRFAGPNAAGVPKAHRVLQTERAGTVLPVPSPAMIHAGIRLFPDSF